MGTLTGRVVRRLSALPLASGVFPSTGIVYDYAIGGLPFLSGASKDRPLERQTADFRKQQIDTDAEPGEQSMVFWWLRSQSSFHAGTGIVYEEPDQQYPLNIYRFADSRGLDVWTPGKASLLPATKRFVGSFTTCVTHGCVAGDGEDMVLQANGTVVYARTEPSSPVSVSWGGTGTVLSLDDDGTNYYVTDATGVYKGVLQDALSSGTAGTKIWNTGNAHSIAKWVKQRLMVGVGPSIYDLSPAGTGGPTLPTPKYTHPNSSWVWTAITETPDSILAAGYAGGVSAIYRFALDTSGDVPTLNAAVIGMEPPRGEIVYSLYTYLGNYVAVGTNKGVRIATVDAQSGSMQYGPISITSTQPVRGLTGKDRFIYAGCTDQMDGLSGVWRLDMSVQPSFRKFAYATDLQTHVSGNVTSVEQYGATGRLVITVDNAGSFIEDDTQLEPTGWLQTGRIRFHTLEPKLFKHVSPRIASALAGSLSASCVDTSGVETPLGGYTAAGLTSLNELAFPTPFGPQEYVSLKFTLARDGTNTDTGPVLSGYQVKALPATKRQRTFILPLMCFDNEVDRNGVRCGGEGTALTRLEALEALEEAGDTVMLQDLSRNPMTSRLCAIDQIRFVQDAPPKTDSGWGGYILLTVRTVT